jgi:WD40 repeat protein
MTLKEKVNIKKAISTAKVGDNGNLLTVDESGEFRGYSLEDYSMINNLQTGLKSSTWNKKISFSQNGEYMVFGKTDSQEIDVFNLNTKEKIYSIASGHHHENLTSTDVDPTGRYFISTGEDGRSFLWNLENGKKIHSFPRRDTEINIGVFDSTGNILATGTEEGKVNVINISTMKDVGYFRIDNKPVRDLIFLSDKYLVSIDKENNVNLWRIADGKKIKTILKSKNVITKVSVSYDEKFLFISTIKGKVLLYDLTEHELTNEDYINHDSAITNLLTVKDSDDIIVTDKKGRVELFSVREDQVRLAGLIKVKQYRDAYLLVKQNEMLKNTKEYEVLEMVWQNILKKSEEILESGSQSTSKIETLLNPFNVDPDKKQMIVEIINDFKQYEKMAQFISKQNYNLAYDIVKRHPNLERTKSFKKLEAVWNDTFRKAKVKLFQPNGENVAKEMFSKFSTVPEKSFIIKNLIAQKGVYLQFVNFLKQKKFGKIIELAKQNSFLETNSDYLKIVDMIDDFYIEMKVAIREGKTDVVLEKAKFLKTIPDLEMDAEDCLSAIEQMEKFNEIVKKGKISEILRFAEGKTFLTKHVAVVSAEKEWEKAVFEAQEIASTGDVHQVFEALKEFETIPERHLKIANIVKIAYMSDLQNTVTDNRGDLGIVIPILSRGIGNYLSMFGKDQEITDLLEEIETISGKRFDMVQFRVGDINRLTMDRLKDSILNK